MRLRPALLPIVALSWCISLCVSLPLMAAEKKTDKKAKDAKADEAQPSYEMPQPATENLDYTMYQRIRDEGLSALARDGVCLRADGWDRAPAHRLPESEARQ